jgi:ABC-type dipeptide/oligopeptide/nickel transport system permease subunit
VAALALLPGFFLGLVAGVFARREKWLRESAADLLLLPLNLLLFVPLVPGAMAVLLLQGERGGPLLVLGPAVLLLPRVAHASRALWEARALDRGGRWDLLVGLSSLFLGTLFIAYCAMVALELFGLGPQPPLPTLGSLLQNGQRTLLSNPQQITSLAVIVAGHALAFYVAADALLDAFNTKRAMAALNQ